MCSFMVYKALLGLLCLTVVCQDRLVASESTWTSLRATWSVNAHSSQAFAKLPRRETKARNEAWTKIPGECSGKFLGSRYVKNGDPATVLIYDINGFIAGVQTGIPKRDIETVMPDVDSTTFSYAHSSAYQLDKLEGDYVYFLTAYFVDPTIICENGRTVSDFDDQGTGTGLYFQNGTDPIRDAALVPLYEEGMKGLRWVRGGCYPTMGMHYWYDVSENMDCFKFFPATVIYNRGKLMSFAFVNFGKFEFSSRFEHAPQSALGNFLPIPIPKCLENVYILNGGLSGTHFFFIRPWNIIC